MIDVQILSLISGARPSDNMRSVALGLECYGAKLGMDRPHRLAQYLAQIGHESGGYRFDRELWNGKGAQARYDTRTDLGNTPERDGDGFLYRGRGPIQITGRYNYDAFTKWARGIDASAPDFVKTPGAVNTDPWEGLGPLWYWERRNLNRYADTGNIEMITRRINGGLNGYDDRLRRYTRAALVLLGYQPDDVHGFQEDAGLAADGISGPMTRAGLHVALTGQAEAMAA